MKFKSVSNICFRKVYFTLNISARRPSEFLLKLYVIHYCVHFIGTVSSVESQLLILYTSAIWSFFTINRYERHFAIPSKIQIRVTNYPSRVFFSFSRHTCCRCTRLDRKSNRTAFLRATERATTPISANSSTFFRYYPSRTGGSPRDGKVRPWREFPRGWDREWNAKFFRNFHEQFHSRAFLY